MKTCNDGLATRTCSLAKSKCQDTARSARNALCRPPRKRLLRPILSQKRWFLSCFREWSGCFGAPLVDLCGGWTSVMFFDMKCRAMWLRWSSGLCSPCCFSHHFVSELESDWPRLELVRERRLGTSAICFIVFDLNFLEVELRHFEHYTSHCPVHFHAQPSEERCEQFKWLRSCALPRAVTAPHFQQHSGRSRPSRQMDGCVHSVVLHITRYRKRRPHTL